ncbi:unnamed protein product [Oppiella nova]|uniref:Presenilin n=1 Tax=Oppiella nova TaxID=334625 RepID=A0A7R9M2F2_9ACAR|nr:unnamed protein product [Oppiella nova]CAG2169539.1 unnamed protein product [Oppiella nova]
MLLVILSIHFFPVFITGFHGLYDEHIGQGKNSSAGDILTSALIMGLFTRCMKAFFILAFVIYFALFGAGYLFIAVSEYNVAMDWISILLILWNYTGVAIIVFFIAGPKLLKQIYLILLTENVALILMLVLPKWTTWVLLFLMCGWDLYAVLHKTGPLNRMMASMDTNETEMPPLLYSTAIWVLMSDKSQKRDTDHDSGVQLGLGDFVFYSLLVGTSFASADLLTAIMCCISILVGLAITLFILLIRNTPLPALPISITLGVLTNFCAEYCVIPFNDALQDRLIFI